MFIRFVTANLDPRSGRRQGLFEAGAALRRTREMAVSHADQLDTVRVWFCDNLPVPTRFSLSSRPHRKAQALSWFKDAATQHIHHIREYQRILELYGVAVEMLRTDRPGYVVYEDNFQVVAYPFASTPC